VNKAIFKTILIITLFSIAMGFLESAVVVYLRELYYPDGFNFPMKMISPAVAHTELLREAATLIMLITIALITGRKPAEKFAYFIFTFAIWDIFYYIFLKLLLNWPASLLTWDVLFLLPFTWVGPVVAPVINSITMIIFALLIIYFVQKNGNAKINSVQWILLIAGSLVVIGAYTEEYLGFMLRYFSFADLFRASESRNVLEKACQFVPQHFRWWIFMIGELMHITAVLLFYLKNKIRLI
jgi:hypothetical protein